MVEGSNEQGSDVVKSRESRRDKCEARIPGEINVQGARGRIVPREGMLETEWGVREKESEPEDTGKQERVDPRAQGNERAGMWKEIRGRAGSCKRNGDRDRERGRERARM